MAVTHLQPLDHRVQRLMLGKGWSGGVSMVHFNASLLPFIALKISFRDKDFNLSPICSPGVERGHRRGAQLSTGGDCRNRVVGIGRGILTGREGGGITADWIGHPPGTTCLPTSLS